MRLTRLQKLAAAFLCAAAAALAQGTGTILGDVTDPSGSAVAGANVTATLVERGTTRVVTTGPDGSYVMPVLGIGTYTIQIAAPGFKTLTRDGIEVGMRLLVVSTTPPIACDPKRKVAAPRMTST